MKHKSLLKQGMAVILIITVIIGLLSASTLYLSVRTAQDTARDMIAKAHESILERLTATLTNIENAIYVVAYSSSIQAVLTDTAAAFPLLDHQEEVRLVFANAFACSSAVIGISLYDADCRYLLSSGGANYYAPDELPEQFAGNKEAVYSGAQYDDLRSSGRLLLVYPVFRDSSVETIRRNQIGYLGVTLDAGLLRTLIGQSEYVEGTLIAFTDQQGRLIMANQAVDAQTLADLRSPRGRIPSPPAFFIPGGCCTAACPAPASPRICCRL